MRPALVEVLGGAVAAGVGLGLGGALGGVAALALFAVAEVLFKKMVDIEIQYAMLQRDIARLEGLATEARDVVGDVHSEVLSLRANVSSMAKDVDLIERHINPRRIFGGD